jgi:hypothetical protein
MVSGSAARAAPVVKAMAAASASPIAVAGRILILPLYRAAWPRLR